MNLPENNNNHRVTHGAVERLYQRVMFEGTLTSDEFVNSKRGVSCRCYIFEPFSTSFLHPHNMLLTYSVRFQHILPPSIRLHTSFIKQIYPTHPVNTLSTHPLIPPSQPNLYQPVQHTLLCPLSTQLTLPLGAPCPMHEENAVKTWLSGFYFTDTSIDASLLTNVELAGTH